MVHIGSGGSAIKICVGRAGFTVGDRGAPACGGVGNGSRRPDDVIGAEIPIFSKSFHHSPEILRKNIQLFWKL
jgi:hypothetical protein